MSDLQWYHLNRYQSKLGIIVSISIYKMQNSDFRKFTFFLPKYKRKSQFYSQLKNTNFKREKTDNSKSFTRKRVGLPYKSHPVTS